PELVTSYDDAAVGQGTVVNQIERIYNGFGQLTDEYQAVDGQVNTSLTPKVQYGHADAGASHPNTNRQTQMILPNGRTIDYTYGSGGGGGGGSAVDDALNRVSQVKDGATVLAAYTYLGISSVVKSEHEQADLSMDLWGGTQGTPGG